MTSLTPSTNVFLGEQRVGAFHKGAAAWPEEPVWDPASLPGLILWLDASQLALADGAYVDTWPDLTTGKVGTNFNTVPNRPTMRANALNALPVVRFTPGGGLRWATGHTSVPGLNWTCVFVSRMWGGTAGRVVSGGYPPANFALGYHGGFEDKSYMEGWTYPDVSRAQTTNWHLYTCAQEGVVGSVKAWFYGNGVFLSGDHTVSQGWQDAFHLNGYSPNSGEETCQCEVAEVLFYDRRLSDGERNAAEDYLRTKWGLP
jgi:hypothetical protein